MSDPYAVPERRAPSEATHLVDGVRAAVNAWRANGYPGASATTRRLFGYWFDDEHRRDDGQPFRFYFCQREAVETFVYLSEIERVRSFRDLLDYAAQGILVDPAETKRPRLAIKMATGSGKTMAMSLCIVWSYFHALFEPESPLSTAFLLIAPNVIVFERLKVDFGDGATFRHDPLVPPEWEEDWELTVILQDDPAPVTTRGVLYLTNVHRLYETAPRARGAPNAVEAMLGPRVNRDVDAASAAELFDRIAEHDRLLVVNDEAHHVWSEKLKWNETIERLHAQLAERGGGVVSQLDFSATPKYQNGQIFRHVVVDYPLKQAVDDGIVKTPLIGEVTGATVELGDSAAQRYRQWLDVAVGRWRKFHEALSPSGKRPVLFVMCENTQAADEVGDYLRQRPDFAGDRLLVIHTNRSGEITKADLDVARRTAREIDGPDSNVRCIVSVLMLREGWDVRNVCVIVTLRSLTAKAKILPEQALGRGLRRMTPPGSGFDERVVVIEHDAFRNLWSSELDGGLVVEREQADLIEPPPDEYIKYRGLHLIDKVELERAEFLVPYAEDPSGVLTWYTQTVAKAGGVGGLAGAFATLAPLVRDYLANRVFDRPVDLADKVVLRRLAENDAQQIVIGPFQSAIRALAISEREATITENAFRVSQTAAFPWSRATVDATRTVFNLTPVDNQLERRFAEFLDRATDVAAFAKLTLQSGFALEYISTTGALRYYYPDFVVRLVDDTCLVLETKGIEDLDVALKDRRARRWCRDASRLSGREWSYYKVPQAAFDQFTGESVASLCRYLDAREGRPDTVEEEV